MSGSPIHRLTTYHLAAQVADQVHRLVQQWNSFDRWTVGVQAVRAADSVGANIAEATGRLHREDKRRLLLIARGSLYELEHWLIRAHARGLLEDAPQLDDLARALNGLIRRQGAP